MPDVIFLKLNGCCNVSYILKLRFPLNVKLKLNALIMKSRIGFFISESASFNALICHFLNTHFYF